MIKSNNPHLAGGEKISKHRGSVTNVSLSNHKWDSISVKALVLELED